MCRELKVAPLMFLISLSSSVVRSFALSFAQGNELIKLPTVRRQRFRAARETEKLLVSVQLAKTEQKDQYQRKPNLHRFDL